MSGLGVLVVCTALGAAGLLVLIGALLQPAPTLRRTIVHLQRDPASAAGGARGRSLARRIDGWLTRYPALVPNDAQLRLVGRTREQHALLLASAAVGGFLLPGVLLGALQRLGILPLGVLIPGAAAIGGAVLGPVLVHLGTVDRARQIHGDLRYQVSAYLDVVTMLLAGNTGYEGALEQAAHAGDGRLFAELRRRMRESGARGTSLTEALRRTGVDLGLDELEQVAATAALSSAEGAPVARTLAAKCATLRAALGSEQESEARLRTSRLTSPIVGMALIFMALVIYPALSFS